MCYIVASDIAIGAIWGQRHSLIPYNMVARHWLIDK